MTDDILIKVDGVSKKFCRSLKKSLWYGVKDIACEAAGQSGGHVRLRPEEFWAVNDVSFEVKRGECLGLIGRNGAGKTTLLRMLNGLIKPDKGRIEMRGRVGALIALGAGFNPILTGRENIYVNGAILGLTKREIDQNIDEIIDFSEIRDFIDAPVQSYSSGMQVRLGFAVATALQPEILLLDEVLAVGDANFRSKCWRRIGELLQYAAVILVSHEAYAISRLCDRAILLDKGEVKYDATANDTLSFYANAIPYERQHSLRFLHESVDDLILNSDKIDLKPGDFFEFDLKVDMKRPVKVDHAVINISDSSDDVHAQCLLEFPSQGLSRGVNYFRVSIGPLFLSKGTFSLMVLISISGGKVPLVHSRQELAFNFDSHVNYGPKYYPTGLIKSVKI
jgi:lipopolysaccharide transport system ATP-binding protein